jgi:exosome complex component RRP4
VLTLQVRAQVVAEVQKVYENGQVILQTNNKKYGKLGAGQMVSVPITLLKRQKQHFHSIRCEGSDIMVILATNGNLWLAPERRTTTGKAAAASGRSAGAQPATHTDVPVATASTDAATPCTLEERRAIARVHNAIKALAAAFVLITPQSICSTIAASLAMGLSSAQMLYCGSAQVLRLTGGQHLTAAREE